MSESIMVKQTKVFVGIDQSYHSTGLMVLDSEGSILRQENFSIVKGSKIEKVEECLVEFEKKIDFIPKIHNLQMVYIEGPAYSSSGSSTLQMGALHYFLRLFLYKENIEFKVIAPTTLKKYIAGTGRAKKDLILLKVYKKWGVEFDISDLADAYGLARMALEEFTDGSNN